MSDGKECICSAYTENECACGADWTPAEIYELRMKVKKLQIDLAELTKTSQTSYEAGAKAENATLQAKINQVIELLMRNEK